ncbi:uncharacterized protein LOC132062597 [Lycium ferocissimum]|uniref:uncharacterized protein LOC132062597 n=1 Tax=Lycium ferocissimum TaxID=112874 RepID=UPI002815EE7D|nr:uncharacterized protein LOC132062597 [Lycium ferocissimum]
MSPNGEHIGQQSDAQVLNNRTTANNNMVIKFQESTIITLSACLLQINKMGLVDGTCKKEFYPESLWNHWERVNAIVLSWLMNVVAKNLLGGIILKNLWEEFHALVPAPACNCPKSKEFIEHLHKLKLFQFLMGLNESYLQARSQILLMTPMPSVNQVYFIIVSGESQNSVGATTCIMGANPTGVQGVYDTALYSRNGGNQNHNAQKFKRNYNLFCEICKIKGHTKETCYKVVGYPQGYRFKKRFNNSNATYNGNNASSAYNVVAENSGQFGENQKMQGEGADSQFLNKAPETVHATNIIGNATGMDISSAAQSCIHHWIVDTGATNHMVADLNLPEKETVCQPEISEKVFLPKEEISLVKHMGSCTLPNKNTITDDLLSGKVKMIGKEDRGLYILSSSSDTKEVSLAASISSNSVPALNSTSHQDIARWHKRFGHVSITVLKKVLSASIDSITETVRKCTFDKLVKTIRTDNGTEFTNTTCTNLFLKLGILHQTSCAYTPQQNGAVERKHRHILEVTRAIRFQAHIPIKFWGLCVKAAVYIINRLPSAIIDNKTHYERPYGKKPALHHLRPRAIIAAHVGHAETQKDLIQETLEHYEEHLPDEIHAENLQDQNEPAADYNPQPAPTPTITVPTPPIEIRKSVRGKKPPVWMKILWY